MEIKYLNSFSEGLSAVKADGLRSYINQSGEIVFTTKYKTISDFSEGLAIATKESGKRVYINHNGDEVINTVGKLKGYSFIGKFINGLARIELNKKFGFINKDGEIVVEPIYNFACEFDNNYTVVYKNIDNTTQKDRAGLIDTKGNIIIDFIYDHLGNYSDGLIKYDNNFHCGFVNLQNEIKINCDDYNAQNYCCGNFENGIAVMYDFKNRKYIAINTFGDIVLDNKYDSLCCAGEGLFAASRINHWDKKDDRKHSLINIFGEVIGNELFNNWFYFYDNRSIVNYGKNAYNETTGVINTEGEFIVNPVKISIEDYSEGLALINDVGFINTDGIIVIGDKRGSHINDLYSYKHKTIPQEYIMINRCI